MKEITRYKRAIIRPAGDHFFCYLILAYLAACSAVDDPYLAFANGDYSSAYRSWLLRAEAGDAAAQNYLGIHYHFGLAVARDLGKAAQWYNKAAKKGHADAQRNYGSLLYRGIGVKQDFYYAFMWFFAAAQQGNKNAALQLSMLVSENKLTPNQQMYAKREADQFILDPERRFQP